MVRDEREDIDSGEIAWEAKVDSNFQVILDRPFPMAILGGEGGGQNEGGLAGAFPAAAHANSEILVEHTGTLGLDAVTVKYHSNGSSWDSAINRSQISRSESAQQAVGIESILFITGSGGHNYDLPAPATFGKLRILFVRNNSSGTVTFVPASGLINGAANLAVPTLSALRVVSDGSNYWTV